MVYEFIKSNIARYFYLINHGISLCRLGSKGNNYRLLKLSFLLFLTGISSTLPLILVIPFVRTISNPEELWKSDKVKTFSSYFGIYDANDLFLPSLIIFILVVALNSLLSVYTVNLNNKTKASLGNQLSILAYKKIIYSSYEFYMSTSSSKIIADFLESIRRCVESINLFLDGITGLFTFSSILITLFFINKEITLILIALVSFIYSAIALIKNKIIKKEGTILARNRRQQTQIIQETLGLKKDILLMNNQNIFLEKFSDISTQAEFSEKKIDTALQSPKYIVEGSFIIILGIIAYFLKVNFNIDPLPQLSSIALGLQKLLPASFLIYSSYVGLKYRYKISDNIIKLINNTPQDIRNINNANLEPVDFKQLVLKNISFCYPGSTNKVFKNTSLIIRKGDTLGIIGETGSGKSTLINLIMGFIKPQEGEVRINGTDILNSVNEAKLIKWRKSIAHVPQEPFLMNATIIENIAYGEKIEEIDFEKAIECCRAASIYKFINNSSKKMYTLVGERGINLSGGQAQRIAIARALYKNAQILILDEATSALDIKTENKIVKNLKNYHRKITIISISHRLSTISSYDRLIRISEGTIYKIEKSK